MFFRHRSESQDMLQILRFVHSCYFDTGR